MQDDINDRNNRSTNAISLDGVLRNENTSAFYPPWIRLPKSGEKCRFTGLSRSSLNALVLGDDPPVPSVVLTQPGSSRGVRLILLVGLLQFLDGKLAEQQSGKTGEEVNHG